MELYRYDALGRRVLTRSLRGGTCTVSDSECASYVQRTVWDGDQVLWEVLARGADSISVWYWESDTEQGGSGDGYAYRRVAYVHAVSRVVRSVAGGCSRGLRSDSYSASTTSA